jgi:hypothetical protein
MVRISKLRLARIQESIMAGTGFRPRDGISGRCDGQPFGIIPPIGGQLVLRQSRCRTIRFRRLRITPPQNAGQNPRTSKPGTNAAANFSIRALITSQKIPKVRTDSGNVSNFKGVPKVPLTNPITTAAMSAVPRPVTRMPGTARATRSKQTALKSQRTRSRSFESPSRMKTNVR